MSSRSSSRPPAPRRKDVHCRSSKLLHRAVKENAMPRRIRAGLIGCGSVALIGILPQLVEPDARERLELAAVCDVVEARAREAAARFGVPHAYADAGDLVDNAGVELVL